MKLYKQAVATGVGLVLVGVFGSANAAYVIGQSYLDVTGFTITPSTTTGVEVTSATNTADTLATLGAVSDDNAANNPDDPFTGANIDITGIDSCVGDCTGYPASAGTAITTTTPTIQFVGSEATVTGSALVSGANALTDNSAIVLDTNTGTAQSNLGLNTGFTITSAVDFTLEFDFDAEAFLRAAISPDAAGGDVQTAFTWALTISTEGSGDQVFVWAPNGNCSDIIGTFSDCVEAFDLDDSRNITNPGSDTITGVYSAPKSGSFGITTGVLSAGSYTLNISQTSRADVTLRSPVPVPGSLALLGLGLLGLGLVRRRFAS